ncbi:MAG TPA: hypothetical protein VJ728_06305 [Candidatus Binataceae bacterium]|nr:hypothetical protein [Candidatus Binataceae bacterium]
MCSDINRLKFYTDILGFTVLFARPEENFAYLDKQGAELILEQPTGRAFLAGDLVHPYGGGVNLRINIKHVYMLYEKCSPSANVYLPMD